MSGALLIGCGGNRVTVQSQPVYQQTAVSQPVDTAQQSRDRVIAALKHRLEMDQRPKEFDATLVEGIPVEFPCLEYSMDDADYLRGWGRGEDADRQTARQYALDEAKMELRYKFLPVPDSIASLREIVILDSLMLDAEVVCEEYALRESLEPVQYWCGIVLQIPREAYRQMPGYDSRAVITTASPGRSCMECRADDADYFRGWGGGRGTDRQTARQHALDNAKGDLRSKFIPVPGSIASLCDTARARLDSLLLDAEVVCEEYMLDIFEPWGYEEHWCEIVVQIPREAYRQTRGNDFLHIEFDQKEFQKWIEKRLTEGLQEPAQDKSDLKPDK